MRKIIAIWQQQVRGIVCSSRWAVISLLSLFLLIYYLEPVMDMARDYELGLCPVVLPFIFSDQMDANLGIMILIFLMSVFPIRDRIQSNIRMRGGNGAYSLAVIMTMITLAILWIIELQIFSILIIGSHCQFASWGKVWGTCTGETAAMLGYPIRLSVSMNIILYYTPYQALFMSALFILLCCILFAEIIILLDTVTGKNLGEIVLSIWCIGCFALSAFPLPWIHSLMRWANPASWLNITDYLINVPYFWRTLGQIIVVLLVFGVADYWLIKRKVE